MSALLSPQILTFSAMFPLWVLASCDANQEHPSSGIDSASQVGADQVQCRALTADLHVPQGADARTCEGRRLSAADTVTITTAALPTNPTLGSSSSGETLLGLWTDGGEIINGSTVPERIWAVALRPGSRDVASSTPVLLAADGHCPIATAFDGGFAVIWADAEGLRLQHLGADGQPLETPTVLLPIPGTVVCPTSLIASGAGLAAAWFEGSPTRNEFVAQVGASGTVDAQIMVDSVPQTVSVGLSLAALGDQVYVAYAKWTNEQPDTAISAIEWQTSTLTTAATMPVPGYFATFFATADQLVVGIATRDLTLYTWAPGAAPRVWARSCGSWIAASDACDRVVALGLGAVTPAGVATGFFAEPLAPAASKVLLGGVSEADIAAFGGGFGILWYSRIGPPVGDGPGALNFTTLVWH